MKTKADRCRQEKAFKKIIDNTRHRKEKKKKRNSQEENPETRNQKPEMV